MDFPRGWLTMVIDIDKAKVQLKSKREEILELSQMSSEARGTVELDQQSVGRLSRMDAMQQQAMASALERTRQRDLVRIDRALLRIADGDYGFCGECDCEIPQARLAIDPMAEKCVRCA
ncbi:MAG: TraR/DksA family transcriptional regulator [Rhizobiaceae bacterium]|nr:TraR/DksA family transcriptional regulator [Rhizobiaceae bacterium]